MGFNAVISKYTNKRKILGFIGIKLKKIMINE